MRHPSCCARQKLRAKMEVLPGGHDATHRTRSGALRSRQTQDQDNQEGFPRTTWHRPTRTDSRTPEILDPHTMLRLRHAIIQDIQEEFLMTTRHRPARADSRPHDILDPQIPWLRRTTMGDIQEEF
eukprot:GEMP01063111.1.p1 GENE.GEMP01063111.1~~GEMP01063111.1.p1  ORF type:complete len:126 (+),score=27.33 GEMP01063111.1:968-1345(+)